MQIRPTAFTIGLIIHFSIALFSVYTEFGIDSNRLNLMYKQRNLTQSEYSKTRAPCGLWSACLLLFTLNKVNSIGIYKKRPLKDVSLFSGRPLIIHHSKRTVLCS